MVRRSLFLTVRLLAWLLASLVVLAAVAIWWLSSGPVTLSLLAPYLERALTPEDRTLAVAVSGSQIRLDRERGLQLVALGVTGTAPDGSVLLDLPRVEVGLSLEALVKHRIIAPAQLVVHAPRVVLTRRADGSIGLQRMRAGQSGDGRGARALASEVGLAALAGPLLLRPNPRHPLSFLELIRIDGAGVVLEDEPSGATLSAEEGAIAFRRQPFGIEARIGLLINQSDHRVALNGLVRYGPARERIGMHVAAAGLRPVDLRTLGNFMSPALRGRLTEFPLAGLALELEVEVSGSLDLNGQLAPVRFSLASAGGRIDLPQHFARPVDLGSVLIRGSLDVRGEQVRLDHLELRANGAHVDGNGGVDLTDGGVALSGRLQLHGLEAAELDALWPLQAARETRAWVTSNIRHGRVPEGEVVLDIRPGDLASRPLRREAVTGWFAFEDLSVRYLASLPPVEGAHGRAEFDAQTMAFEPQHGRVGALRLEDSSILITGIGIKGRDTTQLEVRTRIEGSLPGALALIDQPPLGLARELEIVPSDASGTTSTRLSVGMPLHRDLEGHEVRFRADATLRAVAVERLFDRVDVTDGTFELGVTRSGLRLEGRATALGVPLEVAWEERFGAGVAAGREVELKGVLDRDALAALGVASLPLEFDGGARAELTLIEAAGAARRLRASLDLGSARLALPALDWRKPVGEAGTLDLDLRLEPGGPLALERFRLEAGGLSAVGGGIFELEPFRLRTLSFDRVRLGEQQGAAVVRTGPGGNLEVEVNAQSLDLSRFIHPPVGPSASGALEGDRALPVPLTLRLRAERVLLGPGGKALHGLEGRLARDRRGWREADLEAGLGGDARVALTLEPRGGTRHVELTSSNAGALLALFEDTQRVEGGTLQLEADLLAQEPAVQATGTLSMTDFTLLDAPVLARLLTVASLTGIGNLLGGGGGIFMDQLELPFTYERRVIRLGEGRMSGSQLGLTTGGEIDLRQERVELGGTVVPIYSLNRAIGRIPLIGDFLAGTKGDAAFAATYTIEGALAEPEVNVNPLSALTPGFLRELYSGLRDGSFEPPELPPERR